MFTEGGITHWNVLCNLFGNVLEALWQDKLHETFHSVRYPAMAKIVTRQVARKLELNSIFRNSSCNLSRKDFGRCRVCYTVKCFMQLVPPQCGQNIARQVAQNISQCSSAFKELCYCSNILSNGIVPAHRSFCTVVDLPLSTCWIKPNFTFFYWQGICQKDRK